MLTLGILILNNVTIFVKTRIILTSDFALLRLIALIRNGIHNLSYKE